MATKNIFSLSSSDTLLLSSSDTSLLSPSDTPILSPSGLTGGSIKGDIRINNETMLSGFSGRADACRRMTEEENAYRRITEEELSPSGLTGGSIKTKNSSLLDSPIKSGNDRGRMDSPIKSGNDREKDLSSSDTPLLSFLRRRESIAAGESGRSMTEMLGTLAIIGVLSVGGIAGYSYGMDKYHANQTVNDIMLRAVDIMTQMYQGKDPDLEPEWGTKGTVYNMEPIYDATNNTWGIVVDNVPSRVCQMVGDALKTQATIYVGNAELIDTEEDDPCELSDENTMEFYFEPIEMTFECEPACDEGEICRWGECVNENIEYTRWPTDTACSQDSDCGICGYCSSNVCFKRDGKSCTTTTGANGMCYWGECLPSGCTYDENPCRGKYEYCASPNASNTEAFPKGKTGVCVKADFKPITAEGKEYWVSNTTISWWDADAGCKAIGKEIISAADLITGSDGSEWQGEYDVGILPRKELAKKLSSKLGFWGIWVAEPTDTPGAAVYVYTNGKVTKVGRSYNYTFTVCK